MRSFILLSILVALTQVPNTRSLSEPKSVNFDESAPGIPGWSSFLSDIFSHAQPYLPSSMISLPLFGLGTPLNNHVVESKTFAIRNGMPGSQAPHQTDAYGDNNYNTISHSVSVSQMVVGPHPSPNLDVLNSQLTQAIVDLPSTVIPTARPYLSTLVKTFGSSSLGNFFSAMQSMMEHQDKYKRYFQENGINLSTKDRSAPIDKKQIEKIIDKKLSTDDSITNRINNYVKSLSDALNPKLEELEKIVSSQHNETEADLDHMNEQYDAKVAEVLTNVKMVENAYNENIQRVDEHLKAVQGQIDRKLEEADSKVNSFVEFFDQKIEDAKTAEAAKKSEQPIIIERAQQKPPSQASPAIKKKTPRSKSSKN